MIVGEPNTVSSSPLKNTSPPELLCNLSPIRPQISPSTVTESNTSSVKYWNKRLGLHESDRTTVRCGEWLTDKHINAAQSLLREQFPLQQGLQDTLLVEQCRTYHSGTNNFVQILYINGNHWVCTSNRFSPAGAVDVFDCSTCSRNSRTLKRQLALILQCPAASFCVRHIDVQRQNGSSECGLFAIAFAYTLCLGLDPSTIRYDQAQMRTHYEACINDEEFEMFPTLPYHHRQAARQNRVKSEKQLRIFCKCRLPWDKDDTTKGAMIQCSRCKEWYHEHCCNINSTDYTIKKYICDKC